jgi:hypothetical protein
MGCEVETSHRFCIMTKKPRFHNAAAIIRVAGKGAVRLETGEIGAHKAIVYGMRVLLPLLPEAELKPRSPSRLVPRHLFATMSAKAKNTTGWP